MANTFLTPSVFAQEGLRLLENELLLGNKVHADYSKEFASVGDTISIRRPTAYKGQSNNLDVSSYSEDIVQGKTTLSIDKTETVKVDIGALDATLSFDRVSEDIIQPAMITLKDKVEREIASLYSELYWHAGTPGTTISTFRDLAGAGAVMTDAAIPHDGRFAMHGTEASFELADGLKGVYVQEKAKTAYESAKIGRYGGFENYETVYAPTHTVGALGGTPLVNGANQNTTYAATKDTGTQTLNTDGWSNSVSGLLNEGDIFTIAGVYAVNPVSKESTGRLQTFVVRANADSSGSGEAALTIAPAIITTGAYQTVSAAPADNAAITIKSGAAGESYKQSLLLNPKAFALVTRPLKVASGAGLKTSTKTGNKVTISCSEWVNGDNLQHNMRFDILFGVKALDPRLGMRLTN